MNDARSKTLITVDELVRLLGAQKPVVLLDVIALARPCLKFVKIVSPGPLMS